MTADIDYQLDVCGVCCPMPLIELAKAARQLSPGQTIEVTGNDPIFESSVRDFCQTNGHAVLEVSAGDKRRVAILILIGVQA
jgi:TusA-related sulfurtransferase